MVNKASTEPKPAAVLPVSESDLMQVGGNAGAQLLSIVERVERLEEELEGIGADRAEVFAEAKGNGYDVVVIRKVMKLRRMDQAKRQEAETMLELYETAIAAAEHKAHGAVFKEEE